MVVDVAEYLRDRRGEGVRPGIDVVALAEELEHGGRRSGVVVDRGGVARRRFFGEILSGGVLQELVDRLRELLVCTLKEDELLTLLVVGVSLGDRVDAAFGGGEGLVGVRRPHVEQFDVAVATAVLAEGVVDVRGLADLNVHYLQARILQVRNPDRVDNFAHRQVLREWSLEGFMKPDRRLRRHDLSRITASR